MNSRPRIPEESFYDNNFPGSQLSDQLFNFASQLTMPAEPQYSDHFQNFLDSIKEEKYPMFSQLLRLHPEFATRIDPSSKQTALFSIVQMTNQDMAIQMIRDIISKGADTTFKDPLSQNAIFYIARDGKTKLFDFLASIGVPTDEVDIYRQTPLFYASREGWIDIVKKVLDLGANPNHTDMNEQTCLFYGAKNGRYDVCKMLVEYGVRHEHVDVNKQTALAWAKVSKNQPLIDFLQTLKMSLKQQKEKPLEPKEPKEPKLLPKRRGPRPEKDDSKNMYKIVFLSHSGGRADVTEDEFEKFRQMYPEVAELLMHPERIPVDDKGEKPHKKDKWEKSAKKILTALWKAKGSQIFHEPVDPVKLGCFDYFQIIKQPMDFGTVRNRLQSSHYKSFQEFAEDVNLVFKNCITYNGTGSEVGKVGVLVEGEFHRMCRDFGVEQSLPETVKPTVPLMENKNEHAGKIEEKLEKIENKSDHGDYGSLQDFAQGFIDEDFVGHELFNLGEPGNCKDRIDNKCIGC